MMGRVNMTTRQRCACGDSLGPLIVLVDVLVARRACRVGRSRNAIDARVQGLHVPHVPATRVIRAAEQLSEAATSIAGVGDVGCCVDHRPPI